MFRVVRSTDLERLPDIRVVSIVVSLIVLFGSASGLCAASQAEMNREGHTALNRLYSISSGARDLGESAKAVLVFPSIAKAASKNELHEGYGILFVHGTPLGYYKSFAA